MRSKASIGGHPIHPALVAVPSGLFVWTLIAGLVYLATGKDPVWYDIAYWSGIAAWVSAIVAAVPGFIDLFGVALESNARSIAIAHMGLNLVVVALFMLATGMMWDHGATTGTDLTIVIVLHALGNGLLALSGWLGGEMVYRYHLGMIPDDGELESAEQARHVRPTRPARSPHA